MEDVATTAVLTKALEKWIEKNIDLVKKAQNVSMKIIDMGLLDPSTTQPFTILPTEMFDSDGDLLSKLFVNLDHPLYGYFSIEFSDNMYNVSCSNIYYTDNLIFDFDTLNKWLDELNGEMDNLYKIQSAADNNEVVFCEMTINMFVNNYHEKMKSKLGEIKSLINNEPRTAIVVQGEFSLASQAISEYDQALLMPYAWVVFRDLNDLPDSGEDINDYIDEQLTDKLFNKLNEFLRSEGFLAAPIYLAQRILLQSNMSVSGFSKIESEWKEAVSGEAGEFVLSPIEIIDFKIRTI